MKWRTKPIREFASHAQHWDALLSRGHGQPFLETAFLLPLLQVFGRGNELLAVYEDAQGWVAAAIVQPVGMGRWQLFMPSQLPLGPWIGSAPAPLLASLIRALPGMALSVGLPQLDSQAYPPPAESARGKASPYIDTAWVDVESPFAEYWEARGKNLRNNCRKQRNKLQADGTRVNLSCLESPGEMEQAIQEFGALESAGWKAAGGTAIHPDNDQGRFYRTMLEHFANMRRARVYRYTFDERVVAMDLCIASGRTIVILKTAYDESLRTVSPSTLMRQEQFEALFSEGAWDRIEFFGKVLEWHTRWTDLSRSIYHLTEFRWAWLVEAQRLGARWRQPAKSPASDVDRTLSRPHE